MNNIDADVIVPLRVEHAVVMAKIEKLAHTHPWSEMSLKECFGPLYRVVGIKRQDDLCGFAIVQQIIDEATLLDICVAPEKQGSGLGAALMQQLIDDAKNAGALVLMLEVRQSNKAAKYLYDKVGFIEAGRRKNYYPTHDGYEDAILMDLSLD
ncbi:ribosomal-protein-alanine N-acetyltransferase [Shewanella sp. Actino-trap-3]|jgi:ribosomal-protein-alanine N-acetyltransferase|uniref:ribosomal protein S18-alanine N-acetyltransferase n=1 Tax=Shewanella sp. Actino-trap-3 TaxID=2058331 RepID=UPI000C32F9C4|nr:ribosomal protein S18-alanine N-acetyltransferase [Shewanella sp. Actino-trap-3]PKG80097.1 ribosomal-protein-alanine N-acetyltransferase [Shewanella sp. Actino-trap-3]